jgi:hypothetical protein
MRLDERDHRSLVRWAAACAEHVLALFEEQHPNDSRPRDAVEAGRAWVCGEIEVSEARAAAFAAHAAARDADHAAATAHVASHAAHAAAYAVTAAACAAVPTEAAAATAKERDWQDRRLPNRLRPVVLPARGRTDP